MTLLQRLNVTPHGWLEVLGVNRQDCQVAPRVGRHPLDDVAVSGRQNALDPVRIDVMNDVLIGQDQPLSVDDDAAPDRRHEHPVHRAAPARRQGRHARISVRGGKSAQGPNRNHARPNLLGHGRQRVLQLLHTQQILSRWAREDRYPRHNADDKHNPHGQTKHRRPQQ